MERQTHNNRKDAVLPRYPSDAHLGIRSNMRLSKLKIGSMNRTFQIVVIFAFLFLSPLLVYPDPSSMLNKREIATLKYLTTLLDKPIALKDLKQVEVCLESSSKIIKTLAITILYVTDNKKYENAFFDTFAVHDYVARSKGQYNMIDPSEIIQRTQRLEKEYSEIGDKRILILIQFTQYKDQNKWFKIKNQKISAARFFRSAFLAGAFENSTINALEVTNRIDRITEKKDLSKE
jgi:hypothetical protein